MANAALKEEVEILDNSAATPMMQQFMAIKRNYQDCLLFYRMGDFYELFFDDAVTASKELNIALTKRGKHDDQAIPMCGVPHHSYEPYLHKLIKAGYKVAICEQLEDPAEAKKRGYKAVVKRDVVRIITPGTLLEENLLDSKQSNFLGSLAITGKQMALAWLDISTGEFATCLTNLNSLVSDITRLELKELLISDKLLQEVEISGTLNEYRKLLTPQVNNIFDSLRAENKFKSFFGVMSLDSFGDYSRAEISAIGSLLEYVDLTQKGSMPRLAPPKQIVASNFMVIDSSTRKNLELNYTLSGSKKGSLLSVIDKTITSAGARLLGNFLATPLACVESINARYDMVQFFLDNQNIKDDLRVVFARVPDIQRSLSRICIGKGGPRDLVAIKNGLQESLFISEILEFSGVFDIAQGIRDYAAGLGGHDQLLQKLNDALQEEVGSFARDGNFVAAGYSPRLDQLRELRDNGRNKITELRDGYRAETSINTLKITHNNVLGYFVEVTPSNSDKVTDEKFIHRQTLASAVRYTTDELRSLENDILSAKEQSLSLEIEIFNELIKDVMGAADSVAFTASCLAGLDVMSSFAELASAKGYIRPHIDNSSGFKITGGRHPVVEDIMEEEFIANDCDLTDQNKLWLLTGPNMAGKSTFLRQNAIIVIMAQMGSYVPAGSADIGLVDKVFSRVGASDDLANGRSTFMVEMIETATILNHATEKSLVILDEIGRGTATYDGLSIAWSVVEHLHNVNRCRALFATHYHELTSLASKLNNLSCYTMKVKEWDGMVIFMHEVIKGAADRSYGIHVAKLAGMPKAVTARAEEVLNILQQSETAGGKFSLAEDLPLFVSENIPQYNKIKSDLEKKLASVNIDELSPKDALDILYELKRTGGS